MMERPKVNINFNIDVKLDNKMPIEIKAQIEDAVIRAATALDCYERMGYSKKIEDLSPEPNTTSRHQKAVNENRRISKAIQYIDDCITSFEGENTPIYSGAISNLKYLKKILLSS
jgi:hypothetical protein